MEFSSTNAEDPFFSADFTGPLDPPPGHSVDNVEREDVVVRDEDFYHDYVIFLVEGSLFKVPRLHFIQESEILREMFLFPPPESSVVDGLTDEQPLCLDHILKEDFRQLLKVFYPRNFRRELDLNLEEWTSVLKLSDMWDMDNVRELSISNLTPLLECKPAHQIALARRFHVDEWLLPAFKGLVYRDKPVDELDMDELGARTALKVAAIREEFLRLTTTTYRNGYGNQTTSQWNLESGRGEIPWGSSEDSLTDRLREKFGETFNQL
ncbi:uncharacterized protein LACBIDRAFT_298314 [Laccaria bicolor S238N-H82]|uniref:Predicted protein n=1 Tax=Laccaria bicolor (strain S238N-H82 / ATCC MYA-4686) TaxID=486041 RepID=B0DCQ5_LACBS|nr:uncharacterized protein LACBIDRAFT_298314 [Laccaria bicolor S238N-H82]EDR07772.1 predicted protein [Laccaria bicolor S238N-H82]|eukprot:XP_001881561.1 predicted protein [Laccaria bicolor S238N-H82]